MTESRIPLLETLAMPQRTRVASPAPLAGRTRAPRLRARRPAFAAGLTAILFVALSSLAAAQPKTPSFDHDETRFPLTGRHLNTNCESCHVGGQFAGTPTACRSCHASGGSAETRSSPDHIPVQTDCSDCHTPRFWEPARMDHGMVADACEVCHVGSLATNKPANHIASSNRCGDCHGTYRWEGASFDHSSITGNCVSCHNGTIATGKDQGHVQSSNDCELCHSTSRWSPATGFDHSGITTNCISCHNGTTAEGKDGDHVPSGNDCEVCHSTIAWVPAGFDHTNVVPGTCSGCHNGNQAEGQPGGHFSTTMSCDACHTTQTFAGADYDHTGGNYPGDHRGNPDCTECHGGNSPAVTWSAPGYIPDCAGCHANDYDSGEHDGSLSTNRDCGNSGCHNVRDGDWD